MPIYEYQCAQCDQVIEVRQSISEDKLTTCAEAVARAAQPVEACGKTDAPVSRLISNTSFVLKGSGWYKTDYAAKDASSTGTEAKSASSSEPKTETKSESKPSTGGDSKQAA